MGWLSHAPACDLVFDQAGSAQPFQMNAHGIAARADSVGELERRLWTTAQLDEQTPAGFAEYSVNDRGLCRVLRHWLVKNVYQSLDWYINCGSVGSKKVYLHRRIRA
jgi:hypothetical protein